MATPAAPHPHHKAHLVLATAVTAFVATLAFHYLMMPALAGFGFVLFALVVAAGILILAGMAAKPLNTWAFVFLVPVAGALAAESLYASDVVAALGFLITFVSLTFFGYWLTVPRVRFDQVQSLWPRNIVPEVLLPVRGLSGLMAARTGARSVAPILGGVVLAIPFLIVIGSLFAGADPLFRKGIEGLFDDASLARRLFELCRDIVALLFFLGGGWLLLTRAIEGRKPSAAAHDATLDRTVAMTFLGLLNALFAVFIAFQVVALFGGKGFVESQGLTYAEYARQGFFQLLAVAGIVFGVIWAMYRQTEMRQWGTRGLSLLLIAQTGAVIASAVSRLLLYIDAYGLSVSRYWALVTIGIIAAVLAACFIGALAKVKYHDVAKYALPSVLIAVSALLLVNVEGFVVRHNAGRFLRGETQRLDLYYMTSRNLSTDAIPELVRLVREPWDVEPGQTGFGNDPQRRLEEWLKAYAPLMQRDWVGGKGPRVPLDWREMSFSRYRAEAAIGQLK